MSSRDWAEELIRVGTSRDYYEREYEKLRSEVTSLRNKVDQLEAKYEPKPIRYWKQTLVDENGNEVAADQL